MTKQSSCIKINEPNSLHGMGKRCNLWHWKWVESVRMKSSRTVYKNSTLMGKVVSHGNLVNKSETTIHVHQNWTVK